MSKKQNKSRVVAAQKTTKKATKKQAGASVHVAIFGSGFPQGAQEAKSLLVRLLVSKLLGNGNRPGELRNQHGRIEMTLSTNQCEEEGCTLLRTEEDSEGRIWNVYTCNGEEKRYLA